MSAIEPSEDDISQVCDVTTLDPVKDRFMVTQALKNNNGSVEKVVMQYFDNAETFKQKYQTTWDESMFAADRDGSKNTTGIAFHIDSPGPNSIIQGVTPNPDSYAPGAPSRPPSRSNSPSPWATQSATGMPSSQAQEDEDMQRALRESAQEAGITYQGDSTAIDASTSTPAFGPANRDEYDQANWAMVPFGAPKGPETAVPKASARKRTPGAPALIVQGESAFTHRMGGLLTIFHEIPLVRNILLGIGSPALTYGHNSEWFTGQEILAPHVLARLGSGELQWGEGRQEKTDFEAEVHRLMAFLDSTDRSYATVSTLVDYIPSSHLGPEKCFYDQIVAHYDKQVKPLMQRAVVRKLVGEDPRPENCPFGILEVEHQRKDYDHIETLYEALDRVLWSDVYAWAETAEASKTAMFEEMGDVFVINIGGDGPQDSIEIPEVFYPEKYLATRKDEALRIQLAWCEVQKALNRITEEMQRINQGIDRWTHQEFDKGELLNKAAGQWTEYIAYVEGRARFQAMEESGFDTNLYPDYRAAPCKLDSQLQERLDRTKDVLDFCDSQISKLKKRSKALNDELDLHKRRLRFLGKVLTVPDKPGRTKPMTCHKYLLRGVATSKDVVYVCRRAEADLIELGDEPSKPADQWWRLAYNMEQVDQAVTAEKVEIEQVFKRMWEETKTPMLVYATDEAIDAPQTPLTSALGRFVKADNKSFHQDENAEINEASSSERRNTFVDPLSPAKRKRRSDSPDSMDSNRASLGSVDDQSGFDNPFADQEEREMEDLSGRGVDVARSASIESVTEIPPPLPSRNPPMAETASTTLASSSRANGRLEENEQGGVQLTSAQPDVALPPPNSEPKAPEMQERARPPSFITQSTGNSVKNTIELVDMEIHEE
ncbi:hypothetical protein B0T10DRAFT_481793 [Thelonectria olida]|uniref:Ubiquitin interaction domain-containing protein n=1 Tax=Thelonectria olida TaxID=1576542 RepID=A0A9P9ARR4_9HYPO|nr:hypothetical protein B0T10DRAFT_481793 [Thelonectria olida]